MLDRDDRRVSRLGCPPMRVAAPSILGSTEHKTMGKQEMTQVHGENGLRDGLVDGASVGTLLSHPAMKSGAISGFGLARVVSHPAVRRNPKDPPIYPIRNALS
jgi:hypothetical protein